MPCAIVNSPVGKVKGFAAVERPFPMPYAFAFLQHPEGVDVDGWFADFRAIYETASSSPEPKGAPRAQKRAKPQKPSSAGTPLQELVARFTQATNELQLMGIIKIASRSSSDGPMVKRLMWHSGD